jgi:hypothetical protein
MIHEDGKKWINILTAEIAGNAEVNCLFPRTLYRRRDGFPVRGVCRASNRYDFNKMAV